MNPSRPQAWIAVPAVVGLAACAACCTLPFLVPLLTTAGLGSALLPGASTRREALGLAILALGGGPLST